jgi:hypothetical protein
MVNLAQERGFVKGLANVRQISANSGIGIHPDAALGYKNPWPA